MGHVWTRLASGTSSLFTSPSPSLSRSFDLSSIYARLTDEQLRCIEKLFLRFSKEITSHGMPGISKESFLTLYLERFQEISVPVERVFDILDITNSESVEIESFITFEGIRMVGTWEERRKMSFLLLDIDGDGLLSADEIARIFLVQYTLFSSSFAQLLPESHNELGKLHDLLLGGGDTSESMKKEIFDLAQTVVETYAPGKPGISCDEMIDLCKNHKDIDSWMASVFPAEYEGLPGILPLPVPISPGHCHIQ